jgi:hypothetical protein
MIGSEDRMQDDYGRARRAGGIAGETLEEALADLAPAGDAYRRAEWLANAFAAAAAVTNAGHREAVAASGAAWHAARAVSA